MLNQYSGSIRALIIEGERYLSSHDDKLAKLIDRHGHCTLYDDGSLFQKPYFHTLVWAIINQQLSVASARSIEARLSRLHTDNDFCAETIKSFDDRQLRECGLSRQKIRYIRALCDATTIGSLDLDEVSLLETEQIAARLSIMPGIGPWTIDMFNMFAVGKLDILPLGDLALRQAIENTYGFDFKANSEAIYELTDNWKPYRTIASWHLWYTVD